MSSSCCCSLVALFSPRRILKALRLGKIGLKLNLAVYGIVVGRFKLSHWFILEVWPFYEKWLFPPPCRTKQSMKRYGFFFNVQAFGSPHPERIVNINYDGFAEDVKVGDQFLVDVGTMSSN